MRNKSTWVVVFFIASALLVGYMLSLAFADLFVWLRVMDRPILGARFTLSTLCGMGLGALLALYAGVFNKRSHDYIENVVNEIDKVAWPSWSETRTATITVIVTSCIAALILGVFDTFFGWLSHNNLFLR